MKKTIRFLGGGMYHPADEQAELIDGWLGPDRTIDNRDGRKAFEDLDEVDLFVVAGLHFTGMNQKEWPMEYAPMTDADMDAFRDYVASGRPVLGFHGGVASFDDRPEFRPLLGFYWNWLVTRHTPVGVWPMQPVDESTPVVRDVGGFETDDEIYYNLQVVPSLTNAQVHLWGFYHKMQTPLIMTAEGGRLEGAGKVAYFGLGHSMESMRPPEVKQLLLNTIDWLTD